MYRIEAVLKSPLMIGGKKLNNNYRESKNYIPGSVLRAAYARALIQRCVFEQKNNWLAFQAQSQCEACAFRTVCRHFSEISFPTLYPMGGSPYPVTAREKKYKEEEEKGIFDILKCRLTGQGKAQRESEWSRLEGIHKHGQKVKLMHSAITRTAIDYCRNTAKEGSLYTQNVILEKYPDENNELSDVMFAGQIQLTLEEEKELSQIRILHLGADATRGFGICHMFFGEKTEVDTPEKIKTRIQEFNAGVAGKQQFVILDLLTDAYLELEDIGADSVSQTDISDEQMLSFLEEKIGLPDKKYHLRKAYKFQEVHGGIDTSKETEAGMRRQARLVIQAGAVFVYQAFAEDIDEAELLELEENGIGQYTEHGFGRIRICDRFHVKYDVSGGGMEKEIKFLAEKVLKRETNRFLKEIEYFMEDGGVGKLLAGEKNNANEKEEGKKRQKVPGRKQFKMLMDAVGEASCIEELLLFLSYQKSKKHGWETICSDGEDIAKKLADSFMRIQDKVYKIMEQEDWAEKIEGDDKRLLRLMIAQKYLGYLYWKASAVSRF